MYYEINKTNDEKNICRTFRHKLVKYFPLKLHSVQLPLIKLEAVYLIDIKMHAFFSSFFKYTELLRSQKNS